MNVLLLEQENPRRYQKDMHIITDYWLDENPQKGVFCQEQ